MSGPLPGKIFNLNDATGKERSAYETTAADARINAPNPIVAHQIDSNADGVQAAAQQVAAHAKVVGSHLTGEPTTAVEALHEDASRTTNAAVREGKHDVEEVKAAGAGYVEQAKAFVNSAVETAQSYIPASVASAATHPIETASNVAASLQNTASSALGSVQGSLPNSVSDRPLSESASEAALRVQSMATDAYNTAHKTAGPHIERAKETAQSYASIAGTQGKQLHDEQLAKGREPSRVTTAPLESGPHTVDNPYPSDALKSKKIANPETTTAY